MEIHITRGNEESTLALSGRLDTVTAPKLQEALIAEIDSAGKVRLDFAELTYVSSAGLRVLLLGEKSAKAKGAAMSIANVCAEIAEVFEMTGFSGILTIR